MKQVTIFTLLTAFVFCAMAQPSNYTDERVIFTANGEEVTVGEFEYVYNKNNINNTADYSKESLEEYLNLYINFKLKVAEAEAQGFDTITALNKELAGYRRQLAKSYLTDREIFDDLIKEAYERTKKEVDASHILIQVDENALEEEVDKARERTEEILKQIEGGANFETVAMESSADPSVKDNKGRLGYLTAFQTVYPFENGLFETPVGEMSIVKTRFGFHIIKVHDIRDARGEIKVAHLLKLFPKGEAANQRNTTAEAISDIHSKITSGEITFENAVKEYSDDNQTKGKNGVLPKFGTGRMVKEFETAAFELMEDGQISEPVETSFGWHIIKRIEKYDIKPFDEMKKELKRKVERDDRSKLAKDALLSKIKNENNFKEFKLNVPIAFSKIDESVLKGRWKAQDYTVYKNDLFKINDENYTELDFVKYLEKSANRRSNKQKNEYLKEMYNRWQELVLMDFEEGQLEKKYPDFRALMKEYRDGILLFELTDKMVWSKAMKDTLGLKSFHEKNKDNYMWKERVDVTIYNCTNEETAEKARKLAPKMSTDEIKAAINETEGDGKVSTINGKFEKGQYTVTDKIAWKKGLSKNIVNNDASVTFVMVHGLLDPQPKELLDARGYVVSDYQEHLEKQWVTELREKYPVKIEESVLKTMIK